MAKTAKAANDAVVKIDNELLKRIDELIRKNKFLYSSKKQVVNLAIIEFLNVRSSHKNQISEHYKKPLSAESFLNDKMLNKTNGYNKEEKKKKGEK